MITGYVLNMYKTISWNTGLAAERARHNLKLKNKKAAGPKRQAASFKGQATSATKKTQS